MVTVANREENHALVRTSAIALLVPPRVRERPQSLHDAVDHVVARHVPAPHVAAALHELKVVELLEGVPLRHHRLNDAQAGIVDEHENVWQLQRSLLADGDARGETVCDGLLGGSNQALGPLLVAVQLEVQGDEESLPALHKGRLSIYKDETRVLGHEDAVAVVLVHFVLDTLNHQFVVLAVAEVHLGEDQVQRGRRVTHDVLNIFPILRLRGILVARNNAPLREIQALPWKEHPWHLHADVGEDESVSTPEHFVAAGPDADLREANRLPREVERVSEQDCERHVAHAPRHR
mmetsp:Transcript_46120/g.128261  ORF Transcript_46120/g.128261 Transcript_46120/m.128261 type:complete len:292 (+) Transcript_46120:776-1651(+)